MTVDGWLEGKKKKDESERAGQGRGEGDSATSNPLQFSDTKEKDTMPAILFLSSAATAFVAMTTQADDLIAA